MKNNDLEWLSDLIDTDIVVQLTKLKIDTYRRMPLVAKGLKDAPYTSQRKKLAAALLKTKTLKQSAIADLLDVNPGRVSETNTGKD